VAAKPTWVASDTYFIEVDRVTRQSQTPIAGAAGPGKNRHWLAAASKYQSPQYVLIVIDGKKGDVQLASGEPNDPQRP
jgi:hypothetical protein